MANEFVKINRIPKPPRRKRVVVTSTVDAEVKLRLQALGIDISQAVEHFLNETAGHYVCPTCNALLKVKLKKE